MKLHELNVRKPLRQVTMVVQHLLIVTLALVAWSLSALASSSAVKGMAGTQEYLRSEIDAGRIPEEIGQKAIRQIGDNIKAYESAFDQGKAEAERDLASGHLRLQLYGRFPEPWDLEYERLCQERLGVQLEFLGDVITSHDLAGHADGYNEVVYRHLKAKHGTDVFERIEAAAIAEYVRWSPTSFFWKEQLWSKLAFVLLLGSLLFSIVHRNQQSRMCAAALRT